MTFEEAFLRLNGREPTGEEKRDALMIQDVVRGADLDPILLVFLALGKYETLYRQGAERIATAVDEAALQAAAIGERVGRERAEQVAVEAMIRNLAKAAQRQAIPTRERTRQLAFGAAIAIVVVGAVVLGLSIGRIVPNAAAHAHLNGPQVPILFWLVTGAALAEIRHLLVQTTKTTAEGPPFCGSRYGST